MMASFAFVLVVKTVAGLIRVAPIDVATVFPGIVIIENKSAQNFSNLTTINQFLTSKGSHNQRPAVQRLCKLHPEMQNNSPCPLYKKQEETHTHLHMYAHAVSRNAHMLTLERLQRWLRTNKTKQSMRNMFTIYLHVRMRGILGEYKKTEPAHHCPRPH